MLLKCFLPEFVISIQSRQTANQNGYLKNVIKDSTEENFEQKNGSLFAS